MTIIASLHAIQCEGPSACCCEPIWVRETPVGEGSVGYTSMVGVSDESDTISRGPAVLLTPERRGHSRTTRGVSS